MSLSDYIPGPWEVLTGPITAPFKSREGQPWLQATARNLGHSSFGDKIGNYVDQNYLGDLPQGTPPAASGMSSSPQPQLLSSQIDGQQLMKLVQSLMSKQGGM